jgi:hypothetical protein
VGIMFTALNAVNGDIEDFNLEPSRIFIFAISQSDHLPARQLKYQLHSTKNTFYAARLGIWVLGTIHSIEYKRFF